MMALLLLRLSTASPLTWQPTFSAARCTTSGVAAGEFSASRHTCALPAGAHVGAAAADVLLAAPQDVALYFSPSWNAWSGSGSAVIYGALPKANVSFMYSQQLNSSGAWLDSCPLSTFQETLLPTEVGGVGGGAGLSPFNVANVSQLGYKPPVPKASGFAALRALTVSDGLLITVAGVPADGQARAELYLRLHAALTKLLTPPLEHAESDWHHLAERAHDDLLKPLSSAEVKGKDGKPHTFLRSYYNDIRAKNAGDFGGESVTQFDVLEPLRRWNKDCKLAKLLADALKSVSFYHPEIGCIADTPGAGQQGGGTFTNTSTLDGWYVINPLVKLAELAHGGDGWAEALLLKSLDHIIFLARAFEYVWPVQYHPVPMTKALPITEERSDIYGYAYLMMRSFELTRNATYLAEAINAHDAAGAFHRQEFFVLYERPFCEWGSLALLMMANATGDASFAAEALRPIAYTLPSIQNYQSDHGYRALIPDFMMISAMRGTYSAAFESHHTMYYLSRILEYSARLPPSMRLPAHVVTLLKSVLKYSLGYSRYAYPDKLPAFLFSPVARPVGPPATKPPSFCDPFNFTNDRSIMVPVEDYWGSMSHKGYSPWRASGAGYVATDSLVPLGSIGQEIYGAGLAFEAALLAPTYGSATAANASDLKSTWQLTKRAVIMRPGGSEAIALWPKVSAAEWAKAKLTAQGGGATKVAAELAYNSSSGQGQVTLALPADAKDGLVELVLWLSLGVEGLEQRPLRVVITVARPPSLKADDGFALTFAPAAPLGEQA